MEFMESDAGSADWDWTMDEFAQIHKSPSSIEYLSPSPTKQLSENAIMDAIQLSSAPHRGYSKDLKEIINNHNYYLHYLIISCQIASVSQFLHLSPYNLSEIINYKDHQGNTPLLLAVKLCNISREYLSLVRMLIEYGANIHEKDVNGWKMIDEAVFQKNRELVSVLFEYSYKEKLISWEKNRITAKDFLKALPDFYVEIKWEFNSNVIPLVSKIGPHDTCKLWKSEGKLRFDSTLAGWKNFRSKRRNISLIFDGELFIINHSKKIVVNPLEELDNDETNEVINDIMNSDPVQGNFSLLGHSITQVNNWRGNPKSKNIGNWKAFKHKIQFRTHITVTKKAAKLHISNDYFNDSNGKMPKPRFTEAKKEEKIVRRAIKYKTVQEPTTSNLKNSIVYCWACNNFPITIKELLSILQVIRTANKSLDRLYEFLETEGIASMLPENSFPIKLEIPVSLGITAKATFLNFRLLNEHDDYNIFSIPSYVRVSRRIGQKTLTSPKKRLLFTNIVA